MSLFLAVTVTLSIQRDHGSVTFQIISGSIFLIPFAVYAFAGNHIRKAAFIFLLAEQVYFCFSYPSNLRNIQVPPCPLGLDEIGFTAVIRQILLQSDVRVVMRIQITDEFINSANAFRKLIKVTVVNFNSFQ